MFFLYMTISQSSLSVMALEAEFSSVVVLNVLREGGTFGQVIASWQVTGDHNDGEITPSSGEVRYRPYHTNI